MENLFFPSSSFPLVYSWKSLFKGLAGAEAYLIDLFEKKVSKHPLDYASTNIVCVLPEHMNIWFYSNGNEIHLINTVVEYELFKEFQASCLEIISKFECLHRVVIEVEFYKREIHLISNCLILFINPTYFNYNTSITILFLFVHSFWFESSVCLWMLVGVWMCVKELKCFKIDCWKIRREIYYFLKYSTMN
jgi:hypothetical protein